MDDAALDDIKFLSKNTRDENGQQSKSFYRKSKKLPWNSEILKDRFSPQPFQIQLVELCLDETINGLIVLMSSKEWKNYLKMTLIKQYSYKIKSSEKRKLMLLVTNMGSDVSKHVELLSRHTTLKIAGIDSSNSCTQLNTTQLKKEAHILVMSINILIEWFKLGFLSIDELMVVIFDEVCGSFYNENYKKLIETYFVASDETQSLTKIIGLGSLEISRSTTHVHIKNNLEYLKTLFKCDLVETATDLLDTHNIFYGYEPKEYIHVCDNSSLINSTAETDTDFQCRLVAKIKKAYLHLEELNALKNGQNATANSISSNGLFARLVITYIKFGSIPLNRTTISLGRNQRPLYRKPIHRIFKKTLVHFLPQINFYELQWSSFNGFLTF
jgi:hypothetical protein